MGVLLLANSGRYHFSYQTVLAELRDRAIINENDLRLLAQLRVYKDLYRRRCFEALPHLKAFLRIQECVFRSFRVDCQHGLLPSDALIHRLMSCAASHPNRYCRFRFLEGALITGLHQNRISPSRNVRDALAIIRNQNHYGLFYQDLSIPLAKRVRQIMDELTPKPRLRTKRSDRVALVQN